MLLDQDTPFPVSLMGNMSASKFTVILSHPVTYGFGASIEIDNITLNGDN